MTFLKHVERELPGYTRHYEKLCEYSHPNYYGVAGIYSHPHKETGLIDLGSNIRGGQSHDLICAAGLSGTVIMFHHSYEALANTLPALVELCERLIPPR